MLRFWLPPTRLPSPCFTCLGVEDHHLIGASLGDLYFFLVISKGDQCWDSDSLGGMLASD